VLIIGLIVNTPIDLIFNVLEAENEKLTYDKLQKQNDVSNETSNLFDVVLNDQQNNNKKISKILEITSTQRSQL
jgi:transcription termination factor NusB